VRSCEMYEPTMLRICSLMSFGWPCAVSAVMVRPGRSTSERSGTLGEYSRAQIGEVDTPFCVPARCAVCASMAARICASCVAVGSCHVATGW
jgi:hypothetical protein